VSSCFITNSARLDQYFQLLPGPKQCFFYFVVCNSNYKTIVLTKARQRVKKERYLTGGLDSVFLRELEPMQQ